MPTRQNLPFPKIRLLFLLRWKKKTENAVSSLNHGASIIQGAHKRDVAGKRGRTGRPRKFKKSGSSGGRGLSHRLSPPLHPLKSVSSTKTRRFT